jgi:predicted nucleic acid-binding protein
VRFVDTSFWIAMQYDRDRHSAVARQLWRNRRESLLTTNLVIGETWTFLSRREGHRVATRFLDLAELARDLTVISVDDDSEREAWAWLRRHDERVYSFVDATSFAVMRRLGIFEALAFDGDFSAAGFVEVRP